MKILISKTWRAAFHIIYGVENVELWHRHSIDNLTWGNWALFGTDNDGFYQLYSVMADAVGNRK
ncbi:MAG: hypothetical protein AB1305_02005 [Candidatus Hadarchaeota archaeon]